MELGIRDAAIGYRQNDTEINRIPPIQVLFTGNLSETPIREIDVRIYINIIDNNLYNHILMGDR